MKLIKISVFVLFGFSLFAQSNTAAMPTPVAVVATALPAIPGAIICPDYRSVEVMSRWYTSYWSEQMKDV